MSNTERFERFDETLRQMTPQEILAKALGRYPGRVMATSSFGAESGVLLHMISTLNPSLPVFFLDTGYHFPETLQYKQTLTRFFGLENVRVLKPDPSVREALEQRFEGIPFDKDPDQCCLVNKVEPLNTVLDQFKVWVSGIRKEQTTYRRNILIAEKRWKGLYKINPLADWSFDDMDHYLEKYGIPRHPLMTQDYRSIGCSPCTRKVDQDEHPRSGRWDGLSKTECGLHQDSAGNQPTDTKGSS